MFDWWNDRLQNKRNIHQSINHTDHLVDPVSRACTNRIEASWHLARRNINIFRRRIKIRLLVFLPTKRFLKQIKN